jgi:hypothetical protein
MEFLCELAACPRALTAEVLCGETILTVLCFRRKVAGTESSGNDLNLIDERAG